MQEHLCDTHPTGRLKTVGDGRKKGKCCRKEGLIEDDKELDTESQLEKPKREGGAGPTGRGFRENLETDRGGEERKERGGKGE